MYKHYIIHHSYIDIFIYLYIYIYNLIYMYTHTSTSIAENWGHVAPGRCGAMSADPNVQWCRP